MGTTEATRQRGPWSAWSGPGGGPELPRRDRVRASGPDDVERFRDFYRRRVRPRPYVPYGHVAAHVIAVVAGAAVALSRVHSVRPLEWLALPVAVTAGSLSVYVFHRFVLHVPRRWFRLGHVKHELYHHRFFTHERFSRDEPADLHVVLFPWPSGALVLGGAYLLARGLSPLVGGNAAFLAMLVGVLYFGLYELVHACFHLPGGHRLARAPGLAQLREHHRLHHDPAWSAGCIFNVVLPLFDPVFGTLVARSRGGSASSRASA